jgi:hypothetical protein
MKNPLCRQARSEPFCHAKRQTEGMDGPSARKGNAAPRSAAGAGNRLASTNVACDFFVLRFHRHQAVTI